MCVECAVVYAWQANLSVASLRSQMLDSACDQVLDDLVQWGYSVREAFAQALEMTATKRNMLLISHLKFSQLVAEMVCHNVVYYSRAASFQGWL